MPRNTVGDLTNKPSYIVKSDGAQLAYHKLTGAQPGIIFFGGFASDMEGTKALALETYAANRGQSFVRFDYQGHGKSTGKFSGGTIGKWLSDSLSIIDSLTEGPQILIGSSMGGWITLLAALERPSRVLGLVGIASAPDFTEDLMWDKFEITVRQTLLKEGKYLLPSNFEDPRYIITMDLIEEGRSRLVLRRQLPLNVPIRLIHGTADADVPFQVSLRLAEHVDSSDVEVTLIKEGEHRLSEDRDLKVLFGILDRLISDTSGK